jgi:hypothetical protein
MASSLRHSAARTTFISHLGIHPGDRSSLLVRERPGKFLSAEQLALHGTFDVFLHDSLHRALLGLSHSTLPLVLDLRGVCALDEGFLLRLLKAQRELAPHRSVSFQIADAGPVPALIQRLGLEARFGLELPKRLPLKRTALAASAFPSLRPDAEKSIKNQSIAS